MKLKRAEMGLWPCLKMSQSMNGHIPIVWHPCNTLGK